MMARSFLAAVAVLTALRACPAVASEAGATPSAPSTRFAAIVPLDIALGREARTRAIIGRMSRAWLQSEWRAYKTRFVARDGRIVDNGSGGISHSEGQGYGLLLAVFAGDAEGFERIWQWTDRHLMVRPDGLAAWKWDPLRGEVADKNNASDGDILLAWALAEASRQFGRADYYSAAARIARAIGAVVFRSGDGGPVLMPGADGFGYSGQENGMVVNLSYWIFPAFADLAALAPDHDWKGLRENGMKLLESSRFGPLRLPTDWEVLNGGRPLPASEFPAEFGYNAIRIPLYLAWDGAASPEVLSRFAGLWNETRDVGPFVIDVASGAAAQRLDGAGYRMVIALARCSATKHAISPELTSAHDELYYPETLRLLSIIALTERYPQCL